MKLSSLSKTSLLLIICFGIDKVAAILRQMIIARQFGLSSELDVFNIANNLPDMLFTLISGGALSMALIPVMADLLNHNGKKSAWKLFSSVANLAFMASLLIAIITVIFSEPIVKSEIGIAPGFSTEQQQLVIELMRLNLVAMLIFSVSGLIMGGLQANRHFLSPALAPILYNVGQIFGAVFLAPSDPYAFGSIELPCAGMGIHGLVWGVMLGAVLHLLVQVPALIRNGFSWRPGLYLNDPDVQRVLRVLGPRVLSVFFVQLIFIVRDNYASRLQAGSVTALSYGYMFQQLPETLIGTAIGTAVLPSLSLFISNEDKQAFSQTVNKACRLSIAFSVGSAVIMGLCLGPIISFVFGFSDEQNLMMMWTLRGFLAGLTGHCLLEVANRAYYAQQDAVIPLLGTIINLLLYIICGRLLSNGLDAPGISLTDSIAFTVQAALMLTLLRAPDEKRLAVFYSNTKFNAWLFGDEDIQQRRTQVKLELRGTIIRSVMGGVISALICVCFLSDLLPVSNILVKCIVAMLSAAIVYLLCILPDIKELRDF